MKHLEGFRVPTVREEKYKMCILKSARKRLNRPNSTGPLRLNSVLNPALGPSVFLLYPVFTFAFILGAKV